MFFCSGPLIKEMVRNMEKKASGKLDPDRKMFMYSAHDETVANLLQGLQVFNQIPPPYFSSIIMELSNKSANYFVSVCINFNMSLTNYFFSLSCTIAILPTRTPTS